MSHYLDRVTGAVIPVFSDIFEPDDAEYVDEDELLANPRYVAIKPIPSHEGFGWMERFAAGVANTRLQSRLYAAPDRRRPFRGFKDVLLEYPVEREAWFAFHEERLMQAAREWLDSEELEAELIAKPGDMRNRSTGSS